MKLIRSLCCTFLLFCSLFCFLPSVFALDGPITTPWAPPGEEMHDGWHHTGHDGLDIGVDEGTPIDAPYDGEVIIYQMDNGNGYGNHVAIYCPSIDTTFLFGHCSALSPDLQVGSKVTKGTILAYVGSTGNSSGPHLHVLSHRGRDPYSDRNTYSYNPYDVLTAAGWNLTGNPGSRKGGGQTLPFGVEEFYKMGQVLSDIIKQWALIANKAFTYLRDAMVMLALVLCIIDFCLPIVIGMTVSLRDCVVKVMKYTGLVALIWNWNKFTDKILLNFATTISGTAAGQGSAEVIAENMSNPQLLMQKGIHLLEPGLNKAASFSGFHFLEQFQYILPIYFFTFLVMFAFVLLALFVTLTYLEFYISASMSVVSVPFSAWHMTKFIPEGAVGHLVTSAFKLLVVSFMIAVCVGGISGLKAPDNMFKTIQTSGPTEAGAEGLTPEQYQYIAWINEASEYYQVPSDWMIAMAWQESTMGAASGNIMQITGTNDGWNPNQNSSPPYGQFIVNNYYNVNDPKDSIFAGAAVFAEKIRNAHGNIEEAVVLYNGYGDSNYLNNVKAQAASHNVHLKGGNLSKPFTAEELITFIEYCLGLLGIAVLTLIVPKTIVKYFGGNIELP